MHKPNVIGLKVTLMSTLPFAGINPLTGSILKYGCARNTSIANENWTGMEQLREIIYDIE